MWLLWKLDLFPCPVFCELHLLSFFIIALILVDVWILIVMACWCCYFMTVGSAGPDGYGLHWNAGREAVCGKCWFGNTDLCFCHFVFMEQRAWLCFRLFHCQLVSPSRIISFCSASRPCKLTHYVCLGFKEQVFDSLPSKWNICGWFSWSCWMVVSVIWISMLIEMCSKSAVCWKLCCSETENLWEIFLLFSSQL